MQKLDLMCPSCGAVLKTKSDLDHIQPGVHHIRCEYCQYEGLLDIDADEHVTLQDIEDQSYAKARGEYRAREEYEKRRASTKSKVIGVIVIVLIALIGINLMVRNIKKITLDPFEFVDVKVHGINGEGRAELVYHQPAEDSDVLLDHITYEVSPSHDLKEGDEIVISADSSEYKLTSNKKNITVKGLAMQLRDLDELSDAAAAVIHEVSLSELRGTYSRLAGEVDSIDYEPAGMYLVSDHAEDNQLSDVFRMVITFHDGSVAEYYGSCTYTDIVVHDGPSPTVTYRSSWSLNGSTQRVASATDSAGYTFIYQTLEEAKADARKGVTGIYSEIEY